MADSGQVLLHARSKRAYARAAIQAMDDDARRYRWLRESSDSELCVREQGSSVTHSHLYAYYQVAGFDLDKRIDALNPIAKGE